jgi:Family of unknown function (DUF5670)
VLGIQAKLVKRSADSVRYRGVSGGSRPAIAAAGMLELQETAVPEVQHGLSEWCIHNVPRSFCFGKVREHTEPTVFGDEVLGWQSVYLRTISGGILMFIALFVILLALWLFGWTAMHAAGFAIHVLLILALVSLIIHFLRPAAGPPAP